MLRYLNLFLSLLLSVLVLNFLQVLLLSVEKALSFFVEMLVDLRPFCHRLHPHYLNQFPTRHPLWLQVFCLTS
uniref:Putative secreted protein n=1 Tax=Panstrongylus lignarius TaxID=156445 RepID=A0A224Y0N6_9HEMI